MVKINETKSLYAATPYARDTIDDIDDDLITFTVSDQLFFETLLMNIRGFTISYSSSKKKEKTQKYENLEKIIDELESSNSENTDSLIQYKNELENLRKEKLKGMILRSRAKWVKDGKNRVCISVHWKKGTT